jgi:beta-phosphoglucomutase-like phosphatase (HAD superfamily)
MGAAVHRIHDTVWERSGKRLPDDFDESFHVRIFEAFRSRLKPVSGVQDVLEKLAVDGTAFCVGSSGSHERIRVALRTTGLFERFGDDRLFSGCAFAGGPRCDAAGPEKRR